MRPGREVTIGPIQIRFNWLIFACVMLTAFSFIRLGYWQLGRAEEKLVAQEAFEAQQQQRATAIENLELTATDAELSNIHVALEGEYLNDRTILVLAQFFDGLIGFEVVTPFRLQASGGLVLVSRGWTSGILPPNTPPNLQPVSGPVNLTAQVHVPAENERSIASRIDASQWPLRVRSIEIDIIESLLSEPLFPYVVRLTEEQPGMLVRHWPVTNVDVNANLSYAFQWFTFSALVLIASLLFSSNLISLMRDPEANKTR